MKRKTLIIICAIVVLFAGMVIAVTNGLGKGAKVALIGVDLTKIPDGSYSGSYEFKRWSNSVIVQVKDNRITGIDIEKDVFGSGITHCADEVFNRVLTAQDTRVDAVSGATVTSKAYLKAIEDALK